MRPMCMFHCSADPYSPLASTKAIPVGETVYELRIPWSEVRGLTPEIGAKLGLSLRLSDADGAKFGRINWGMGLDPAWSPSAFGVLTLVGP